jgi:hypothetical protein
MTRSIKTEFSDHAIRYYIYTTFRNKSRPPTTWGTTDHFANTVAQVEDSFERLADAHQIALTPESSSIWMANPFSSVPTNDYLKADGKRYWCNSAWDVLGISLILDRNAIGYLQCGCEECDEKLVIHFHPGKPVNTNWMAYFGRCEDKISDRILPPIFYCCIQNGRELQFKSILLRRLRPEMYNVGELI